MAATTQGFTQADGEPTQVVEVLENWSDGVNTTLDADDLPPTASPRGFNSILVSVGAGTASVAKRQGMSTMNATPITASPAVIGQYVFKKLSSGTLTAYHLLVSNARRFDLLAADGTLSEIGATTFTTGDLYPAFETMSNLVFIVNGTDAVKYNGTAAQTFGITRPTVGTLSASAGAAGLHNGVYELRVSYANTTSGHESSISDTATATVQVTNSALSWANIPISGDTQVNCRYLYIRNTDTMAHFYRAGTVSNNTATTATTTVLDANLIIVAPDTAENDPPLSTLISLSKHASRLFGTDGTKLYYSNSAKPEGWDPDNYEEVNPTDGQKLVALHSAHEMLIIFKTDSIYVLDGTNPQSWEIRQVDPTVGCKAPRSIRTVEGITYWWSETGPMMWDGANRPIPIGDLFIRTTINATNLNYAQFALVVAEVDYNNQTVIFAVPGASATRNTILLPWNYRLGKWEATKWDPMDVCSMTSVEDAAGKPWVMMGGYAGQVFKWWNATNDGVISGTTTGTFVASAASHSTITDNTASFLNTGGKLIERKVTVLTAAGQPVTTTRPYITTNNGTVLTLSAAITGLTTNATYTYIVGGPDFQWDTGWSVLGLPFHRKRFHYLYSQLEAATAAVYVDLAFNYDTGAGQTKSLSFTAPSADPGVVLWDSASHGTSTNVNARTRIGRTGTAWKVRYRQHSPGVDVVLLKTGVSAEVMTDKLG